jgi:hypothetical protein
MLKFLGHIIKYKLPLSNQGSPTWHKSQLQDLLTMVEEFASFFFNFNYK